MAERVDVAVVGAGIVGLAFAWEAARRGKSVAVFDRSPRAQGASVRNFGMVWPIGQPAGACYTRALRSRERWLEYADGSGIWLDPCGSLHVAYHDDEDAVLREFAAAGRGIACEYVPGLAAAKRFPAVNPSGLKGALFSPVELAVDPREAVAAGPQFLTTRYGVAFHFRTAVTGVEPGVLRTAGGAAFRADRVFVCSGTDFETLFPDAFAETGAKPCKLQMLRTPPQPGGWKLGQHLCGGLTLCHYKSFRDCPTLPALRRRYAETMPEYGRYGIHVMASQNGLGELVIGDSHEYGDEITPFDRDEIDRLILKYLSGMLKPPDPRIAARWNGEYAKHPSEPVCFREPVPGCTVVAAVGGAGMTLSFGFAREWWEAADAGRTYVPEI